MQPHLFIPISNLHGEFNINYIQLDWVIWPKIVQHRIQTVFCTLNPHLLTWFREQAKL